MFLITKMQRINYRWEVCFCSAIYTEL